MEDYEHEGMHECRVLGRVLSTHQVLRSYSRPCSVPEGKKGREGTQEFLSFLGSDGIMRCPN